MAVIFYIYCFLGWVWESCYVLLENKKWTNRGFMKGPFLPIYGSGAIIILIATIPFKENLVVVFFMGMIAATLLEYFTGMTMDLKRCKTSKIAYFLKYMGSSSAELPIF